MSLHHRRDFADMRSAYGNGGARARGHSSGSESERSDHGSHSDGSKYSQSPPTSYSSSPARQAPIVHNDRTAYDDRFFADRQVQESPRSSIASTVQSQEELLEDVPAYEVPEYSADAYESTAVAATPRDFSELFPSKRRLAIRHDDTTIDGNMNLRVDTEVVMYGERCDMTLFHLRMHDLKTREFSLRRYCRDSGREVCHSTVKQQKSSKRPGFHRSLSNALNSMRPKSEHRKSTDTAQSTLTRQDSGYGSMHSVDFDENDRPRSAGQDGKTQDAPSVDNVHLEFSNYAQVDVKRTGNSNKRYEFEYWGAYYSWRRLLLKGQGSKEPSFQLTKAGSERVLAHIVPVALSPRQAEEEQMKGGWIPPCSMWIADESILSSQKDLSDVVVAAGLIALVDDAIRARFHSKSEKQLLIPIPKIQMDIEHVAPKRLINEMFGRKDESSNHSRPSSSGKPAGSIHARPKSSREAN